MDDDEPDGPLDPRIQIELENLNSATDDINKLEIELDEAHKAFNQLLSDSTRRLKDITDKLGVGCIEKARCYYEAVNVARQARIQCQRQAQLFQRASEIHAAAKETVALAEARFMSHRHEWNFDQAWQDMLNHATIKVMDAENQKADCAREHHRRASLFHDAEKKVQQLEEKHRRSIIKAKPYFDVFSQCEQMLAMQKERVECLQKAVKDAKRSYASSLNALEEISNRIHQQRRDFDIVANGVREPGVGAELISPADSLNYEDELKKINVSRMNSVASSDLDMDERTKDFEDVYELKSRMDNLVVRSVDGSESTSNPWELELQASMEKLNSLSATKSDESRIEPTVEASTSTPSETWKQLDFRLASPSSSSVASVASVAAGETRQPPTQSPFNALINKSKLALRNGISSLNGGSVGNFTFGKTKVAAKTRDAAAPEETASRTSRSLTSTPLKTSKNARELPLLSIFKEAGLSRDKSYSLANLTEKNNLKTLLEGDHLTGIQTVSLERLANARQSLVGDKS